jgi:biopolymer transport protein ExbB
MSFNLIEIFQKMGPFALAIVAVLVVMAMASMAVFVERVWTFWRSRRVSRQFAPKAAAHLGKHAHDGFVNEAKAHSASHMATLLASGMKTYIGALKEPGELGAIELTKRELARRAEAVSSELRRGMSVLASVGSVAPFVGLLGTVVGIISAFEGIAKEGSGGLGAVSAGISEALIVTALGLVVAIPSVLAFNFLSARVDALLLVLEQSRGEFVDYLENQHGKAADLSTRRARRDEGEKDTGHAHAVKGSASATA